MDSDSDTLAGATAAEPRSDASSNGAGERRAASFADAFDTVCRNVTRVIRGKDHVVQLAVLCLVAEGHLLVEDVPGVGKTTLAKALARSIRASYGRIQFTPDLLPSDVVGTSVWNQRDATFEFRHGPIFANLVLADEINRGHPKTQSALLEAMAEEQVTIDGTTYRLNRPHMVIATQNPIEHHGTYPLLESQLDRFLMKLSVGYPDHHHEMSILEGHGDRESLASLTPVVEASHVAAMVDYCKRVHVSTSLASYLVDLATASRSNRHLTLGISPRALLGLQRAVRVRAAVSGRSYATPDDVKALAEPVLAHRLMVTTESQVQGLTSSEILAELLRTVPVPTDVSA